MNPFRRTLIRGASLTALATLSGLGALPAGAQPSAADAEAFPRQTIKYVVPFSAGGLTDQMARLVGQKAAERWKQPVVVDNRPGANAQLGADLVAKSAPDGYTWLAITMSHAANVTLLPKSPFDLQRDLVPVATLGSSPMLIVVPPASPIRSVKDLTDAARKQPLNAGSSGNGTPPHLTLALFQDLAKAELTHVPYKGGAPSLVDLMGGQIDVVFSNLPESLQHVRNGKLRAIAVTSKARHPLLPEVPTTAEQGMPELVVENWTALMMPAATPPAIVQKVGQEMIGLLGVEEVRQKALAQGFTPMTMGPQEFAPYLKTEVARWAQIIQRRNIKVD